MFEDRRDAGNRLAERLSSFSGRHALVLGLARGGVPVAAEFARHIQGELGVLVVRKLGAPGSPELAIGAVTASGGMFLNTDIIRELGVRQDYIERVSERESAEARRLEGRLRGSTPRPGAEGRVVILVDDGLATGATMRAAARALRHEMPARTVIALPVGSGQGCEEVAEDADETVCLHTPEPFWAVGLYYEHFEPVSDEEVRRHLQRGVAAR
ncbi:MAG TPA: phosphoribosyltransferase family protein [Dehalococcoidia bacterium]|nr:phosphoribosyltransferase family protein [Dehalococcoidia bacterium]